MTKSEQRVRSMFSLLNQVEPEVKSFTLKDLDRAKQTLGSKNVNVASTLTRMVEQGSVETMAVEGMAGRLTFYRLVD